MSDEKEEEHTAVETLDFLANHFAFRDWDYTRNTDIKSIRYLKDVGTFGERFKRGWIHLTRSKKSGLLYDTSFSMKVRMFFYCLELDPMLPDGSLNNGGVISFWEEDGEYIQMVQPSVGCLLVDFLKECPDHKHAKIITAELERIQARYSERIAKGEVADKSND